MTIIRTLHRIPADDAYVARQQRLILDQGWKARLMYRSSAFQLAILAVILFPFFYARYVGHQSFPLPLWLGALALWTIGQWTRLSALSKSRAAVKRALPAAVELREDGIRTERPRGSAQLRWSGFPRAAFYPDGVLLIAGPVGAGLWLPDAALAEGTPEDVRALTARRSAVIPPAPARN